MDLVEIHPDDADAVRALAELRHEVVDADSPWVFADSPYRVEMEMRHGWDGEPGRCFLALEGTDVVGALQVDASTWDNTEMAWLRLEVRPTLRRQGRGRRLLELATEVTATMGRPLQAVLGWDLPAVHGFAATTGFDRKTQDIHRRRPVHEVDPALVQRLYDEAVAASADYELVGYEGRTPDDLLDAVAVMTAAINDAPLDDLEYEDEVFTAQRVRDYETAQLESGFRLLRVLARHRGTGELAGHSVVAVDTESPSRAAQHDTSVLATHRGHRLGLLLKARMVLWLAETAPEVSTVDTWNAESNDHMIAVNERLGYRAMGREVSFQRRP
ncbi:MAG: GCN5-related N-acetyltransferase [Nocardioidaceae bacterium]|nr:GCN5-related N-acetyltransferase [Nocardioidaceae bacterium]